MPVQGVIARTPCLKIHIQHSLKLHRQFMFRTRDLYYRTEKWFVFVLSASATVLTVCPFTLYCQAQ